MQNEQLRQTQIELETSRDRFVELYDFAPMGYLGISREGLVIECNLTAAGMLGRDRSKLLQKRLDRFVLPDDLDIWGQYILAIRQGQGQTAPNCELRFERSDGTSFAAQLHCQDPSRIPESTVARITLCDITRRRQAEEELRASRNFLTAILDSIGKAVVVVDRDLNILQANSEFTRQSGCEMAELIGRKCYEVSHKRGFPCKDYGESCAVDQTLKDGERHTVRHEHTHKDGSKLYVESKSYPLMDLQGKIGAVVETQNDITDIKFLEEDRLRLQQQLNQSQKLEAIGRLAGGMAHDFNNMLGVILGQADLALMNIPPESELHEGLQSIIQAGQRSAALIAQLLAFARKQTISPKVLDLNEVVGDMIGMLRRLIGENIALTWQPGKALWRVKVDLSQVDQVLANLVVNARDAITDQGRITIMTDNVVLDEQDILTMEGALPAEYVRLSVADNGCGMEAEVLAHIFEPFFTTKEFGQGTGLGLASVFGTVRQNGGCLKMESTPGTGSTCHLFFPRHPEGCVVEPPDSSLLVKGNGETLLLVEDEPALLDMFRKLLETLGYKVLAANTARHALELAASHDGPIDLLIVDVIMPEINGHELAKQLLAIRPDLPCLYVSGYSANILAAQGILHPEVNLLAKPFSIKNLAARVRQSLEQQA